MEVPVGYDHEATLRVTVSRTIQYVQLLCTLKTLYYLVGYFCLRDRLMTYDCLLKACGSTHFVGELVIANERVLNEIVSKCGLASLCITKQGHSLLHNISEAEVADLQLGEEGVHFFLLFLAALDPSFVLYPRTTSSRSLHHTCYISARIQPQPQHISLPDLFLHKMFLMNTYFSTRLLIGWDHLSRACIGEAIINLSMQLKLLVLLLLVSIIGAHVLRHFEKDIVNIKKHYAAGETSKAYSILMKMLIQTKTLYEQLDLPHPNIPPTPALSCPDLMQELVHMLSAPGWIERYQDVYVKLHGLQKRCTSADFRQLRNENGFDDTCALCTVLTRVMENYITYHRKDVAHFVEEEFCSMFDGLIKPTCEAFVHYAGPRIIRGLLEKENSDQICHGSNMCKDPKCRIFGSPSEDILEPLLSAAMIDETKPSPWQWLIDLFTNRFGDKHNPPFDLDNDSFSDISTFRGYHWRGVDCNELDSKVYPGRKVGKGGRDHDCNGIFGKDTKGDDLQEKLCGKWTRLGVGVVGDSAGAHFSIPEKFFNVTMMQKGSFHDLLPRIADELDIPYESAYTGHVNTTYNSHSIYKYLRRWNMCNNNDFQNLGVNGGDSGNSWGNIKALQRSQATDHPMLLFIELIGNDVCGSSVGGTNPADFKKNIRRLLDWLDTKLPKGSHVMIFGLADGDLLYEYLQGTIHPLNVTYDKVYDFLNCLKISPCAGWLSTNATARQYTTALARNLSKMYQQIIDQGPGYANYDLVYHDFPIYDIFERMYLDNREPREMIERCDGFHPSVLFNSYLADWTWYKITTEYPHWIGEQNPNNQEIKKIFGLKDLE